MIQDSYARTRNSHKNKLREEGGYFGPLVSGEKSTRRWLAERAPWPSGTPVSSACLVALQELNSSALKLNTRRESPFIHVYSCF